ncbi:hypothetical protein KFL_013900010, partial [Klebsormidium nitens]
AVVKAIEDAWTLDQCLAAQIHCKIGHSEKWQFLINLLSKTYNSVEKQWVRRKILGKGSKVYLPLLKSKNQVNAHRAALHAIIPLIQNEDGTACWTELPQQIVEAVRLDRERGYLRSNRELLRDFLWLHWGGDAAGWLRGTSHSIWGFKLLGNNRVVTHSPKDMRVALTFEGKDKYSTYLEYLQPFLEPMQTMTTEGLQVENTHYTVNQTLGADYVLMSELLGHSGASSLTGCCFCEEHKDNYGKTHVVNGRRVPLTATPRTTESMAAAAHRPWTTGPGVECPYCHEQFPNQEAVDASQPPQTKGETKKFQQSHAGMRFGTPPIFRFPISAYAICILHLLLRLMAITFHQTIAVNLNTPEKTDAVNALIKALHLGCKKLEQRTASGDKKKDTTDINFIGRWVGLTFVLCAFCVCVCSLAPVLRASSPPSFAAPLLLHAPAPCYSMLHAVSFCYAEVLRPLHNPGDDDEREAKSIVVQDRAVAYVHSFSSQLGADLATLYMHLGMVHVPDMVRRFAINFSDMSQQFVEHKLKEGKTDMQLFTNKRLVDERQQKGRNLQVMAKGRERLALEQTVAMPLSRNERRFIGDGEKVAEQAIERAERRGQLPSRSKAQLESKLEKLGPDHIARVYTGYVEIVEKLAFADSEESPGEQSSARLRVESENRTPGGLEGLGGDSHQGEEAGLEEPAAAGVGESNGPARGEGGGEGRGGGAGARDAEGVAERGRGRGTSTGTGRGAEGRGAGRGPLEGALALEGGALAVEEGAEAARGESPLLQGQFRVRKIALDNK